MASDNSFPEIDKRIEKPLNIHLINRKNVREKTRITRSNVKPQRSV